MTAPPASPAPAPPVPAPVSPSGPADDDRFQLYLGSLLFTPFAGALFDQIMLPEVAAGVEWTGRIRYTPLPRALRSAAAEQSIFSGDDADNEAVSRWLRDAHRVVRGVGPDGVRFSALNPESWNWIMASAIMAYLGAYTTITGEKLDDAGRQQFYELFLRKYEHLQLPGKHSRLPGAFTELLDWYESVLDAKGERNATVDMVVGSLLHAPAPRSTPAALRPLWRSFAAALGHVMAVCSFGAMHPKARALTGFRWTKRHDVELKVIGKILPVLYVRLPKRLTMASLAYHQRRYAQAARKYRSMQLDSFAPGCPMARTSPRPRS